MPTIFPLFSYPRRCGRGKPQPHPGDHQERGSHWVHAGSVPVPQDVHGQSPEPVPDWGTGTRLPLLLLLIVIVIVVIRGRKPCLPPRRLWTREPCPPDITDDFYHTFLICCHFDYMVIFSYLLQLWIIGVCIYITIEWSLLDPSFYVPCCWINHNCMISQRFLRYTDPLLLVHKMIIIIYKRNLKITNETKSTIESICCYKNQCG